MSSFLRPVVVSAALLLATTSLGAVTVKDGRAKMGTQVAITVVAPSEAEAFAAIEAGWDEIDRIEARISSWRDDSETAAVVRAAGGDPVVVSEELFGLVERALKVSRLTGGAFDPTFGGVGRLWDFRADPPVLPDAEALRAGLELVDWRRIELDRERRTVRLPIAGMRLGFGGIGKGYAANRVAAVLRERGIVNGLVDAGGDLLAFGLQEDGEPWTVAIADPTAKGRVFARLPVRDGAVVTSGDYERYVEIDGVRYAHILDPRTGWPVRGLRSVTVVCPDAELADALATSVFVMGRDEGLELVDRLRGVEALVVDDAGQLHFSRGLRSRLDASDGHETR